MALRGAGKAQNKRCLKIRIKASKGRVCLISEGA